jgi:hypothetical protein
MKGKILLLTGLAVGYVLGTRAGRERYEEIRTAANKLWNDPRVQKPVHQAQDFAKDKAPEVAEFVTDSAKKVVSQISGKTTTAKKPATKPSTASKPASTPK